MAAYAALTSLMHIIDQIQHHPSPPISIDKQQVQSLTEIVTSLLEFLELYHSPVAERKKADLLEMRIADAAYAAEDVIQSLIVTLSNDLFEDALRRQEFRSLTSTGRMRLNFLEYPTKPKSYTDIKVDKTLRDSLYKGLQREIIEMDSIKTKAMEMKVAVEAQLQRNASAPAVSILVGLDDDDAVVLEILDKLTAEWPYHQIQIIPIVGMGGIGKTTFARHVYAHPLIKHHFDIRAWATISQQYNSKEILCELLSQANKQNKQELSNMSEDELGTSLHKYLFKRRFLIVMDDMWSVEAWDKVKRFFPDNNIGSRIVVTTRLSTLGSQLKSDYGLKMKFLDEVTSWTLFSKTVFGEKSFPPNLEEIGKKILQTCKGLPLSIVVMGGLLKKLQHTQECWESLKKDSSSAVNSADEDFCLKILKMSYNHLPAYLKPCFLYMGVFEEDCVVRVSTLIKLWVSEGFLRSIRDKSLETTAKEYLHDLVERNLILVHELGSTGSIKFCKIHDLLRDLCCREAHEQGFYDLIGQHKFQGLNRQRCVVIPGGTSKEEVHDALRSMQLARSFVYHREEVVPLPDSRLLRTLKAYDRDRSGSDCYLLDDLFKLVNLRYLAVGVDGVDGLNGMLEIPDSVNFLWNLQTLIIFHSARVQAPYFWKMPQLRHLEFHKGDLYLHQHGHTTGDTATMNKLQTLKGVNLSQFEGVQLSSLIPNIKKLGVTGGNLTDLSSMRKLESYHYCCNRAVRVNTFLDTLKKLSLASHADWIVYGDMLEKIGLLPNLQKLKLERAQYQEGIWQTKEEQFPCLKFLELKWCVLKSWTTESSHFPLLEKLHLYALKELEEIPCEIGEISTLQSIQLDYCSESVVKSAKAIAEEQEELQVRVVLLKTNQNLTLRSLASPNFLVEIDDF